MTKELNGEGNNILNKRIGAANDFSVSKYHEQPSIISTQH